MIILFTDFGVQGPYLGQMEMVIRQSLPSAPVVNLVADAPAFDPRASAYLLAALATSIPAQSVVLAVVDPGVGGERLPLVAEVDGVAYVGPDNGLFEILMRRGKTVRAWEIVWRPEHLSASFHGRDLFAPVAARLAAGLSPEDAGCRPIEPPRRAEWPDDLPAIIYHDHYGNAWTGLRASILSVGAVVTAGGRNLGYARTFSDVPPGEAFWYENSSGLVEIAVNSGAASSLSGLAIGDIVTI
jgi:S-adenosylmethionine hydrolase